MRLLLVFKENRSYPIIAFFSAIFFFLLYLYTQVLGNLNNIHVWVANTPLINAILLVIFLALFGITFAYQTYLWRSPAVCTPAKKTKGRSIGGIGALSIFLVAQCPACASLGALFLPVSALTFLYEYTIWLNAGSILLLFFTLHYLGAFQEK
ncbi:MAG: hypothetical protein V1776_03030 [Candidatus Diapherotrites archaeon]